MFDNFWGRIGHTLSGNWHYLLVALGRTLELTFISFAIGLVLATLIAISFTYEKPKLWLRIINRILRILIWLIRSIPAYVMLLLMYFVILAQVNMAAMSIAIIAFTLYNVAFITKILENAIASVDKGQYEAGRALGMGNWIVMFRIVLPQALKNSIQALGNQLIYTVKNTSVVGFITVIDVTRAFQLIAMSSFDVVVPYILLGIVYVIIVGLLTLILRFLEKKVFVYTERMPQKDRRNFFSRFVQKIKKSKKSEVTDGE